MKILVVDDEKLLVKGIRFNLELDPNPTMTFKLFGKIDSCYGIGVTEEQFFRMFFTIQVNLLLF